MGSVLKIDPNDFRELIDQAVDAAVAKLEASRPRDAGSQVLWTKKQTSDALGMSEGSVDRLRKLKGLPACKLLGGAVYFRPEAVREWAKSHETAGGEQ